MGPPECFVVGHVESSLTPLSPSYLFPLPQLAIFLPLTPSSPDVLWGFLKPAKASHLIIILSYNAAKTRRSISGAVNQEQDERVKKQPGTLWVICTSVIHRGIWTNGVYIKYS